MKRSVNRLPFEKLAHRSRSRSGLDLGAIAAKVKAGTGISAEGRVEGQDSVALAQLDYSRPLHFSLTVKEAARKLKVSPGRIRRRLTAQRPTLLGIKTARGWRLPRYQFQNHGLVPGIERVIRSLDKELHPVAVSRWFCSPTPDLEDKLGEPLAPLDWLKTGRPPGPVAELARHV